VLDFVKIFVPQKLPRFVQNPPRFSDNPPRFGQKAPGFGAESKRFHVRRVLAVSFLRAYARKGTVNIP
jgi:hypothetical protein